METIGFLVVYAVIGLGIASVSEDVWESTSSSRNGLLAFLLFPSAYEKGEMPTEDDLVETPQGFDLHDQSERFVYFVFHLLWPLRLIYNAVPVALYGMSGLARKIRSSTSGERPPLEEMSVDELIEERERLLGEIERLKFRIEEVDQVVGTKRELLGSQNSLEDELDDIEDQIEERDVSVELEGA